MPQDTSWNKPSFVYTQNVLNIYSKHCTLEHLLGSWCLFNIKSRFSEILAKSSRFCILGCTIKQLQQFVRKLMKQYPSCHLYYYWNQILVLPILLLNSMRQLHKFFTLCKGNLSAHLCCPHRVLTDALQQPNDSFFSMNNNMEKAVYQ